MYFFESLSYDSRILNHSVSVTNAYACENVVCIARIYVKQTKNKGKGH